MALRQVGTHSGFLVRWTLADLAAGGIDNAEWWAGEKGGWLRRVELPHSGPVAVIDNAGNESSLHYDERLGKYVHVASYGFGAAWIGLRTAPSPAGPWSEPVQVYRPPELAGPRPFVYSAIAHPGLNAPAPGELIVTYATNSFDFSDLFSQSGQQNLYWPRVIAVAIE